MKIDHGERKRFSLQHSMNGWLYEVLFQSRIEHRDSEGMICYAEICYADTNTECLLEYLKRCGDRDGRVEGRGKKS